MDTALPPSQPGPAQAGAHTESLLSHGAVMPFMHGPPHAVSPHTAPPALSLLCVLCALCPQASAVQASLEEERAAHGAARAAAAAAAQGGAAALAQLQVRCGEPAAWGGS
jgi:hypothetical protein